MPGVDRLRVLLVDEDAGQAASFREILRRAYADRADLVHFLRCDDARDALTRDDASGVDIAYVGCRGTDVALALVRVVRARHPLLPLVVLVDIPPGAGAQAAIDDADIAALHAGADDSLNRDALDAATLARVTRYALERAKSNRSLLESEQRYRALFEAHPLPLWLYEPGSLRIVDVNPAAVEKYGWSREELLGMTLRELRDPAEIPSLESALTDPDAVRKARPWRHRTKAGEELLVDTFGRPVVVDGRKLRLVAPVDRTGEYRAVEALRQANDLLERRVAARTEQLEASERRYRTLAELAPQVVWSADNDGRLTYLNRAWYAMVGGAPSDWLGLGWFAAVHPDDLEGVRKTFFEARARARSMQGKRRIRAREGGWRTTLYYAAPVPGPDGRIDQWIGVDTDITELERNRELIEQANADLEAFSYAVSHDLRAPLHVIQGFSEALLNGEVGSVDDTAREYLGRVVANTQKMSQLIQDILRLSRVTREPLDCADFDVMALARETMASVRARYPGRQLAFEAPGSQTVRADRRLIGIVLDNLFDNAMKFSARQPAPQIRFEARAMPHGGSAFEVRDNGVGFPAAWRDPSFGSFQRLHSGPEFPGNGIGLATVARIVRRHGGRLEAEGAPEGGAIFRFTLAAPAGASSNGPRDISP